jgi:hypothetical protein
MTGKKQRGGPRRNRHATAGSDGEGEEEWEDGQERCDEHHEQDERRSLTDEHDEQRLLKDLPIESQRLLTDEDFQRMARSSPPPLTELSVSLYFSPLSVSGSVSVLMFVCVSMHVCVCIYATLSLSNTHIIQ